LCEKNCVESCRRIGTIHEEIRNMKASERSTVA
jgi:hypothetical protein